MEKKKPVICRNKSLKREAKANLQRKQFQDMLVETSAVDLRDNITAEDLGNGYIRIDPIDDSKRYGPDNLPTQSYQCEDK